MKKVYYLSFIALVLLSSTCLASSNIDITDDKKEIVVQQKEKNIEKKAIEKITKESIIKTTHDAQDGTIVEKPNNVVEYYVPSNQVVMPQMDYADITIGSGVAAMFTALNGHNNWFYVVVPEENYSTSVDFHYHIKDGPATYSYGYVRLDDEEEEWVELGRGNYYGGEHKVRIHETGYYKFYVRNEQSDPITIEDGYVYYD